MPKAGSDGAGVRKRSRAPRSRSPTPPPPPAAVPAPIPAEEVPLPSEADSGLSVPLIDLTDALDTIPAPPTELRAATSVRPSGAGIEDEPG